MSVPPQLTSLGSRNLRISVHEWIVQVLLAGIKFMMKSSKDLDPLLMLTLQSRTPAGAQDVLFFCLYDDSSQPWCGKVTYEIKAKSAITLQVERDHQRL